MATGTSFRRAKTTLGSLRRIWVVSVSGGLLMMATLGQLLPADTVLQGAVAGAQVAGIAIAFVIAFVVSGRMDSLEQTEREVSA